MSSTSSDESQFNPSFFVCSFMCVDTRFYFPCLDFRAAVLCAVILLHTADAASASGLFNPAGSTEFLTRESTCSWSGFWFTS